MTIKKLTAVGAVLIVFAIAMTTAEARTTSTAEFDRHASDGRGFAVGAIQIASPRSDRAKRKYRQRHHHDLPRTANHAPVTRSDHVLVAKTGARASVSTVARPHFVCLLNKLEAVGYRIDFMGGYAQRGNSSAHPTGNALDINQTGRNIVTRRLPANATEMARGCGLVHGAVWSNPDAGHFEMPRKYGYVIHHHRHRYASAR